LATLGETDISLADRRRLQDECSTTEQRDIGLHAKTATQVVNAMLNFDEPCTLNQVVTKCKFVEYRKLFSFPRLSDTIVLLVILLREIQSR
jgi:hypothetical protein